MEHTKHLWRIAMIIVVVLILFVVVRHFMIPKSFGLKGHYRYDSLQEFMEKPVIHGSRFACTSCHEKVQQEREKGKHASVSCEVCHAPLSVHVKGDMVIAPMPVHRSHLLCANCHQHEVARPKSFPQIAIKKHLEEAGVKLGPAGEIADGTCLDCHSPHRP